MPRVIIKLNAEDIFIQVKATDGATTSLNNMLKEDNDEDTADNIFHVPQEATEHVFK